MVGGPVAGAHRKVCAVYAATATAWILLSSGLVSAATGDTGMVFLMEAGKGLAFVGLTTLLLFVLTRRWERDLLRRQAQLADIIPRFQAFEQHCEDVIWTMDADGRFTYCSPSVFPLRGFTPAEVMHQTLDDILTPESRERAWARLKALPREPSVRGRFLELEQYRKDGGTVWTEVSATPVLDAAGRMTGVVGVTRDLSRRKAWEADLLAAHEAAEAADRAKSDFLAVMSHEIRTPMNGIVGIVQLLKEQPLPPEPAAQIELLSASAVALLALLGDVLDLSRLDSSQLEISPAPFALRRLLADVVELHRPKAAEKGLALDWSAAAPVRDRLEGDAGRLRQVLGNLLSNAIKFTAEGRVTLTVLPAADGLIRFEVADTGMGIDRATLDRLFQPFIQGGPDIARRFGGTGLGLAICKRLAEAQCGRIGADSEPGRGSRFWVELPLPAAGAEPPALPPEAALPPLEVLLAEDNAVSRKVMEAFLHSRSHHVTAVADGLAAIEAAAARRFDIVLMDLCMPLLDGLEATRQIRALPVPFGTVPILALTASAFLSDVDSCRAAGMTDFVSKPVDFRRLQDLLVLHCRTVGAV